MTTTVDSRQHLVLIDKQEAQLLADLLALRDAAVQQAPKHFGSSIEICVSGNGESWGVYMNGVPLTELSCATSFGRAINEAAETFRRAT